MIHQLGQRFGNCILTRLVGRGGFADVYQARQVYLKRDVAIKVLRMHLEDEERQNFQREAQIVASLDHPHIVRVFDSGMKGSVPYLVMSYAAHGSLRERHPHGSRLSLPTILHYLRQLADALEYIHKQGLIHRDIKPENMLLGKNYELLLSDFGIAILASGASDGKPDHLVGTLSYMAPERLQGHAYPASDQYALAVTIYEWLAGERPFNGSPAQIASQHTHRAPPSLREKHRDISAEIEQIVFKALEKDPLQRFESVQEFVNSLEKAARASMPQPSRSGWLLKLQVLEETAYAFIFDAFASITLSIISILFNLETASVWFILGLNLLVLPFFSAFARQSRLATILAGGMLLVSLSAGFIYSSVALVSIIQLILIALLFCIALLVRLFSSKRFSSHK